MLDKTIPFAKLYMRRKAGTPIQVFPLPENFKFVYYKDGDESDWAKIEASVEEFDSEFSALMLFKETFITHVDELYRRCLFVENSDGKKVATATAWWSVIDDKRRAWLQWVSVAPGFQGLGLGKAIVSRVTEILLELEGDVDFYLGTQTWSYKAINIYKKIGYEPTDEKKLYGWKRRNHYKKALKILERVVISR